jgi:hypothetical protein
MHESKKNEMGGSIRAYRLPEKIPIAGKNTDCRKKYRLPEKIPIADA